MFNEIVKKIEEYDKIIVQRHKNPDLDAYGSQIGLKRSIKLTYPEKEVYAVGDENGLGFLDKMDIIDDDVFNGSLVIITDVAVDYLISDDRFKLADFVIIIDHHMNSANVGDLVYIDNVASACCTIISQIIYNTKLKINAEVSTALFGGIVTDTGRFFFPGTNIETFEMATYLLKNGADKQFIYDSLYSEDLNTKRLKGYFVNNFKLTSNGVAYMKNDASIKNDYKVSTFTISRGMVNQMANIKNVPIWVNFTHDDIENIIYVEMRSSKTPIIDIARKYGGGGHNLACGCYLKNWEETDALLSDLDELVIKIRGELN